MGWDPQELPLAKGVRMGWALGGHTSPVPLQCPSPLLRHSWAMQSQATIQPLLPPPPGCPLCPTRGDFMAVP